MQNTPIHKSGIKTTEFWATVLGTIIVAFAKEFGITIDSASSMSIAAMIITYIIGRVVNKTTQSKILNTKNNH